ncbi:MAG: PIN domain-containing protein [bacterium]
MLFLDANIILEILFKREKYELCLLECQKHESICISPTSIHIIYYYAEKAKLDLAEVEKMLGDIAILPFTQSEFKLALSLFKNKDMKDALQVATAINSEVEAIFTLDLAMINKYQHQMNFITA